jgi:MFS family permease
VSNCNVRRGGDQVNLRDVRLVGTMENSSLIALRNLTFRRLWFASVLSGIGVAAYDCAAVWAMYKLNASPLLLSLMSSVASLPFFLFILPAGALADIVDRRKLLWVMNLWLAVAAGLLAALAVFGLLNPFLVLLCVFFVGVGFAFTAPAWPAVVSEVVSPQELPSALTLGGLQLNIAAIIGPTVGGLLLPLIGTRSIFSLNAVCFLIVALTVWQWKPTVASPKLPLETFVESFLTAIRYVRHSAGVQVVLIRNVLFAFFIAVIPSLIPVIGLKEVHLNALGCGLMFSAIGAGSVFAAILLLGWAQERFSPNVLTISANLLLGIVFLLMAFVRNETPFILVACLAGIAWTLCASELWVAGQRSMPDWARARMNATFFATTQGAMVLGGIFWGTAASVYGPNRTLVGGAVLLFVSLIAAIPLSINFTKTLDLSVVPVTGFSHKLIYTPKAEDGPVVIHFDIEVDPARRHEFLETMKHVRTVYLRNGAFSWRLHEDLGRVNTYRVEVMVPSWSQYLLQAARLTKAEKIILDRVRSYHVGSNALGEQMFLCVNKELQSKHHRAGQSAALPVTSA